MGQGLGLPHKGSLRAGRAVEAWFGTSTVASLAQPSGVGESSFRPQGSSCVWGCVLASVTVTVLLPAGLGEGWL